MFRFSSKDLTFNGELNLYDLYDGLIWELIWCLVDFNIWRVRGHENFKLEHERALGD